jgi:hypothetical protein
MNEEKTLPVILIGVDPIEAKGFNKVSVKIGGKELFLHEGTFDVHMEGETLAIQFRSQGKDSHFLEKGKSPHSS